MLLPPIPPWEGAHVVLVHVPLGLAFVVPILMVVAMFARGGVGKGVTLATLVVVLVAVAGAFAAVLSGEAASEFAGLEEGVGAVGVVYEEHEEAGELARTLMAVVGGAFLLWTVWLCASKRTIKAGWRLGVQGVLLVAWLGCSAVLGGAAHLGGRLVHEFGVHAPLGQHSSSEAGLEGGDTD